MMNYELDNNASIKDASDPVNDNDDIIDEQSKRNNIARKRIDDLLEKKRLKELLDDEEDWDV